MPVSPTGPAVITAMRTARAPTDAPAARGITLIELMVVVAIVAILAAFAYPAYQDQVRKSRRSDAKAALQTLATRLEQYYLDNKAYTTDLSQLGYTAIGGVYYSPEQYYALAVNASVAACPLTICYGLTATAQAKGNQNSDTACPTLQFNSRGTKAPTGCW
jgi:type IV pilus assembly protein PilE